jgi:hypothetical protein
MLAKRLLITAILLLGGMVVAALTAFLVVSDDTLLLWLAKRAEVTTGLSIHYREPAGLTRTLHPTLTVTDLEISDPGTGYRFSTSSLELRLSLPGLLLAQLDIPRLWLGDTRVAAGTVQAPGSTVPATDMAMALYLKPALHDVRIERLSIVHPSGAVRLPAPKVDDMELGLDEDSGDLVVRGRLQVADQSADVTVTVPALSEGLKAQQLDIQISAQTSVAGFEASGHVDFTKPRFLLEGNLSAHASELKRIPTGIPGLEAPGSLAARARFDGTPERLAVNDILLGWQGPRDSTLTVRGDIADIDDLSGVELQVAGHIVDAGWLAPLLPDSIDTLTQTDITAQVSGDADRLAVRDFNFSATDASRLQLSAQGRFDLVRGGSAVQPHNLALSITFDAPTTHAARALLFEGIPEFGAVLGSADIRSTTGDPSFENVVVSTRDPQGIEVDLKGRIADFPLDAMRPNRGYDLDVAMRATRAETLGERLGLTVPLDGPAESTFRIEGDSKALRLERIAMSAGKQGKLGLSASGQIYFGDWDQADPLQMINLYLEADSDNTRSLGRLLDTELPELGGLTAKARLQTVSNRHQITEFRLRTTRGAPADIELTGTADRVVFLPEPAVEDIALRASAATQDLARLNSLFDLQGIPALGPGQASARITGSDQTLTISNVTASAGTEDALLLRAKGGLGSLAAADAWHLRNTALEIKANAPGTKALAEQLGLRLPELGPVAATGSIRSKGTRLELRSGRVLVGAAAAPLIEADGYINNLLGAAGIHWNAALNGDGRQLARLSHNERLADLGAFSGELQISDDDGSLGIDKLSLSNRGSDLVSVAIKGHYGDFSRLDSLAVNAMATARDLEVVGNLFGFDWPDTGPFRLEMRTSRAANKLSVDTTVSAGKAETRANLDLTLDARPLLISGKVVGRNAFVPSLVEELRHQDDVEKPAPAGPVFSREPVSLDWMKKIDLDLDVNVRSFDPELSNAESARATVTMRSGELRVTPATVKYPEGQLTLDLYLDARSVPQFRIKAFGKDLNPWRTLYLSEGRKELKGNLDVDIDLALSGRSVHELVAGADGSIYLQLQNGAIRRELIELLFVDFIGWAETKATRDKYSHFDCGVADYGVAQGVVSTKAFILDAKSITISGEGTIDLGTEQIDYAFLPRKKSNLIARAEPVKITGSLSDPKVSALPWKSAAATYGTLWFAPYVFVGVKAVDYLASRFRSPSGDSPCLAYQKAFSRTDDPAADAADAD